MGGLFSKKTPYPPKNCEITEQDQAILQLKTQRDKIKQFIRRKEKCMERERELARQLIKDGRKDRALLLLKKKRYQENVIERTLKQLDNIDRMVHDLEFADIQQRVVEGLRQGNDALKKMNAIFDIDEIEKLMEETKEAAEYQEEISALLTGQLSSTDVEEAEHELEQLLASQINDVVLPDVPAHELPHREKEKETAKSKKREAVATEV
ncbi:Charged multivesicular body protein 6 [Trichostrongylus colubriformis]|uniref:Charged multivesicular body protein 6 n=1 Tax=Trichostrongylus colubriformis TaxID=6319 RepID=A0AAN8IHZ3_TRICO